MSSGCVELGIYWRGFRAIFWAAGAGVVTAAIALGVAGQTGQAIYFLALMLPVFAFLGFVDSTPPLFASALIVASVLAAAGWVWNLSARIWFYDEMLHGFVGFAATAVLAHRAYYPMRRDFVRHPLLLVLAVVTFGLAIGAAWEIYEWFPYSFWVSGSPSYSDTISDLALDGGGALVAAWLVLRAYRLEGTYRASDFRRHLQTRP